ncbi:MAG: DUF4253 domain-containing protein [Bacteroidota bacterium]
MKNTASSLHTLSIQTGVEIFAIKLLEEETTAEPEHLKTYFSCTILRDDPNRSYQNVPDGKVVLLPGVCFPIESKQVGLKVIRKIRSKVEKKGYRLFLCDGNNLGDKNKIAIIRCNDEFTPLVYMQTNGINHGVETYELISHLDSLNETLDLKLIGTDFDWCEFEIRKDPNDWHQLAEKLYEFCPGFVEQRTGDIRTLEAEIKEHKRLYYWFD